MREHRSMSPARNVCKLDKFAATTDNCEIHYQARQKVFSGKCRLKGTKLLITENLTRRRSELLNKANTLNNVTATRTSDSRIMCLLSSGRKVSVTTVQDLCQLELAVKSPNRTTQSHPPDSIMANNVYTLYMDLSNSDNTSENVTFIFNNISTSMQNCEYRYFTDSELII